MARYESHQKLSVSEGLPSDQQSINQLDLKAKSNFISHMSYADPKFLKSYVIHLSYVICHINSYVI